MVIRVAAAALAIAALFAFAPAAMAFDEVGDPPSGDCASCHDPGSDSPHGGYATSTHACASCHTVHAANPSGYALLPGPTIVETCNLCHDGTGGKGVYGTVEAALGNGTLRSAHRTDTTATVPGGDVESGGPTTLAFEGLGGTLSCGDCHSPHAANVVGEFTGDRVRVAPALQGGTSSRLLRRRPGGTETDVPVYGSDWCASCHAGRVAEHQVINHPVETSASAAPGTAFTYQSVQRVTGVNSTETVSGSLGRSNFGYVMPYPRTVGQGTHLPVCQQCHEDARSVGDVVQGSVGSSETFSVRSADGIIESDNPRFQVFPHESDRAFLGIESDDDLCTNCHSSNQLE